MTTDERIEGLEDIYKFTYPCKKCGLKYGSDKEENQINLCPLCEKEE